MSDSSSKIYYVKFDGAEPGLVGQRSELKEIDGLHSAAITDEESVIIDGAVAEQTSETAKRNMGDTFTIPEVSRLFEVTESRLRYWDRSGFISPSGKKGGRRRYTFQDLVALRSAVTLLEKGVSLQRVRRLVEILKEKMPQSPHPLGSLRIMGDEKTVVVTGEEFEFEADSGQLLINFSIENLEQDVIQKLPPRRSDRERTAFEWYLEGCRLDESEDTFAQAEEAYYKAIHLDPALSNAYTNLGNLLFRNGAVDDARALYEKAVEVDASQPEGHYNLGFLDFEDGLTDSARGRFTQAVELDPTFADAHYNLAMVLYRLGKEDTAADHLRTYLELEPGGPWAELAKQRLAERTT